MVLAPVAPNREDALRKLLASMNHRPGVVNPENVLVPFGQFNRLHFARFLILKDQTLDDIARHGVQRRDLPTYLAFLGDCDGPAGEFLSNLAERADGGLRMIFSHCQGFTPGCNLLSWMSDHEQPPATTYVNYMGRTLRQIREESALRDALEAYMHDHGSVFAAMGPMQIGEKLRGFVRVEQQAGRLSLTTPERTPLGWRLKNLVHAVGAPLVLLLVAPILLLYLPIFVFQLRRRERQDPEIVPKPEPDHVKRLADLEDHGVTNQFSAMGTLKPGLFRRWTLTFILWGLDYMTRHIFNRGHLARVDTIHFARWVFLDNKKRLLFASNYDGSLESYMDDFINKVAWGLNLAFSNGVGYPRTNWLIRDGAKNEQKFKYYIRRHELPTEVWYNAHPGLTAFDLKRNARIRQGLETLGTTEAESREWLRLL
jgi:hypothetical protein